MCEHDGTATGVLTGACRGELAQSVVCETCGLTLATRPPEPYRLEPLLEQPAPPPGGVRAA